MKMKDLGEFGFIDRIKEDCIYAPKHVVVGIGDDGAVYTTTPGAPQIAVIDTMVEGVHFVSETMSYWQVGYKAVASNFSDIAAMGGIPTHIVLSVAIPKDANAEDMEELYQGIKSICCDFGVNILGGDTVTSLSGLVITVSAFGELQQGISPVTRYGANTGDCIGVTHVIGDAAGGLDVLLEGKSGYEGLKRAHTTPIPQVMMGELLGQLGATSMNDISDGLASELNEIAKASHKSLYIQKEAIPLSKELRQWSKEKGRAAIDYALYGGEDYQLVFTMPKEAFQKAMEMGLDITEIGWVGRHEPVGVWMKDGDQDVRILPKGYDHFAKKGEAKKK